MELRSIVDGILSMQFSESCQFSCDMVNTAQSLLLDQLSHGESFDRLRITAITYKSRWHNADKRLSAGASSYINTVILDTAQHPQFFTSLDTIEPKQFQLLPSRRLCQLGMQFLLRRPRNAKRCHFLQGVLILCDQHYQP